MDFQVSSRCNGAHLCGNCFGLLGSIVDISLPLTVKISCSNFGHLWKWIWGWARSCGHLWIVEWLLSRERRRFLLNPIAHPHYYSFPFLRLWGGNFCILQKVFIHLKLQKEGAFQQHFLTTLTKGWSGSAEQYLSFWISSWGDSF